ncbi:MAG TPA: BrxA family protein [Hyphomicrobiaceae bacterium]
MKGAASRPYLMSFGAGGLFINESVAVARQHRAGGDWEATLVTAQHGGAFPVRKASSARRSIREIVNRLRWLSADEFALLIEGERSEQAALLWLAACRAYRFIGEFAVEVLNERFLSFRTDLTYDDFDIFLSAKEQWSQRCGMEDQPRPWSRHLPEV